MATTKTLAPTNQTITIADFQGEKPDQRQVADAEGKLADAVNELNSQIVLPNPTGISSLDDLKNHLLAIHNSIANNGVAPSHIDVASSYSGGFFNAGARYMGTYKRSTANQGVIEYSSPLNGDTVGVGLYSISTTPSLNVFSPYRQDAKRAEKRVQGGETASFSFSSYNTSALIFGSVGDSDAILYVYSNGYLVPVKTSTRMTVSLSSDYKTVTVSVSSGTGHIGCISANLPPTVT